MTETADIQMFNFTGNRLAFRVFGNGPRVLLAFHGFGQNSLVFESLKTAAGAQFTVFCIDLFLHGDSHFGGNQLLTKTDWQRLIRAFLRSRHIDRFSLLGFSLGGRFALATAEAFADRLDQLILIAPDGITRSSWYRAATSTTPGRMLFRFFLRHLSMLSAIGRALTHVGFLHRTAMRFAEISLGTPEQRLLVYRTWTEFRLIRPDLALVARLLNDQAVRVRFFTGAFDRIVPGSYVLPLTKQLRRYELTVLQTGHNRLIDLVASQLTQRPLHHLPQPGNRNED